MPRTKKVWDEEIDAVIEDEAIKETEDQTWTVSEAIRRILAKVPHTENYDTVYPRLTFHRELIREEDAAYKRHQAGMKLYGAKPKPKRNYAKRARPQEKDVSRD